jgi:excisionase family DNA binding protein
MSARNWPRSSPPLGGYQGGDGPSAAALTVTLSLTDAQLDMLADLVAERMRPPTLDGSPWLDTKGAANYIAAKPGRIHDLVALGKLTPRRDGRRLLFARADLDAYLEASV